MVRYSTDKSYTLIKTFRINNQIRSQELRVIDERGENLGTLSLQDALAQAQERGLDLIEIAPEAKPPVAKIVNFDKFRYQQEKEAKRQQQKSSSELKQIRLSARSADNDLRTKAKKLIEFLNRGDKVEILLRLRGREKYNREWAMERMEHFLSLIKEEYPDTEYKILSPAKFAGQGITMQIGKK